MEVNKVENLKAKLFISGKIRLITGLHIGGSSTALDIGGIDSNVIKTGAGIPYIPGSSLKGKMRTLIGLKDGKFSSDEDTQEVKKIFGSSSSNNNDEFKTRLYVRDSYLDIDDFNKRRETDFQELELEYSEAKWENVVNRIKGTAEHPRQIERIPAGALFNFSFVYNIYENDDIKHLDILFTAMKLLEDDYLGGNGSRGYGQIKFEDYEKVKYKTKIDYENENKFKECKAKLDLNLKNEDLIKELADLIK